MGFPLGVRPLAGAAYRDITRRPLYTILLLLSAAMIFLSQYVTLFSFYQEMSMVREMGMAAVTFFGFLVLVILTGVVVTSELEDRTAVTLLSKPISRAAFLLGKFFGILAAILPGVVVLAGVLFVTLWWMARPSVFGRDAALWRASPSARTRDPLPVMQPDKWNPWTIDPVSGKLRRRPMSGSLVSETWGCLRLAWRDFVLPNGGVVLQGAFLSLLQLMILTAWAVSLAAFSPLLVSTAATTLLFILGNLSSYMVASVERWNVEAATLAARILYYTIPNLGYFNLQTFFSEGRIISFRYLGFASIYAVLYTAAVFLVSCAAFRRREIR